MCEGEGGYECVRGRGGMCMCVREGVCEGEEGYSISDKPEKVRPNTNSSGFSIVFGVCVLVTTNLAASNSATRGAGEL